MKSRNPARLERRDDGIGVPPFRDQVLSNVHMANG